MSLFLPFSAMYTKASGSQQVPSTGLTVTCTVRSVKLSDNSIIALATAQSAFEIGSGLYGYTYSGTLDFTTYYYVASFTTTDASVQATVIAGAWFDYPLPIDQQTARAEVQSGITKNAAIANFEFLMVQSSDHQTPATGLSITPTRSIDGGAFSATTNAASEVGSGIYKISLSASDLNGTVITLQFAAVSADTRFVTILTTP